MLSMTVIGQPIACVRQFASCSLAEYVRHVDEIEVGTGSVDVDVIGDLRIEAKRGMALFRHSKQHRR
jgi:hypothetical protein